MKKKKKQEDKCVNVIKSILKLSIYLVAILIFNLIFYFSILGFVFGVVTFKHLFGMEDWFLNVITIVPTLMMKTVIAFLIVIIICICFIAVRSLIKRK